MWSVLLAAALAAIVYGISVYLHPYTPCRRCDGHGRSRGVVFTRAYALCGHCNGTGHTLRLGAHLIRGSRTHRRR